MAWMIRALGPLSLAIILFAVLLAGCEDEQQAEPGLNAAFLTPVAAAREAGLSVYWLGPSFEAGGVLFTTSEAKFPEGIAGVPLQGLVMRYSSGLEPGGFLDLQLLSKSDWGQVKEKLVDPQASGAGHRAVSVAGREGDLFLRSAASRPLNALSLIVDLGDVALVADTNSSGAVRPGGPDYNPFINNPDLLVQVMQDLRPYPE